VPQLAECLGVGDRQLRRLFDQHLGASPVEVAQTQRLLLAKELIDETSLPMIEVALAAGFSSVRRFNDVVKATYAQSPTALRRARQRGTKIESTDAKAPVALRLPFRPPHDWNTMLAFLGARAIPGVEEVIDGRYRRTLRLSSGTGTLEVERDRDAGKNALLVRLHLPGVERLLPLLARVRHLFDLDADSETIDSELVGDPRLRATILAHPGIRVPGTWDPFELTVRAILGQQISVSAATTLAGRLVKTYGEKASTPFSNTSLTHLFPSAACLATADSELTRIGLPKTRAATIASLAQAVRDGSVVFERQGLCVDATEALLSIRGIGPWTAQYVALRAARDPDVMMAGDLGVRRALATDDVLPSEREALSLSEGWRPWRSYAVLALWNSDC